jgi:hypothetical protein
MGGDASGRTAASFLAIKRVKTSRLRARPCNVSFPLDNRPFAVLNQARASALSLLISAREE